MSRLVLRATETAHQLLAMKVQPGDAVLDATAGQGRDSCFLAGLVGKTGRVWAFDIQPAACTATAELAKAQGWADIIQVICDDHAHLARYIDRPLAAVVFNLGWLPGGDHTLITRAESTLAALEAALTGLKPGGIIVVVAYPGHPGGQAEYDALSNWLALLDAAQAAALEIRFPSRQGAPMVILIEKTEAEKEI